MRDENLPRREEGEWFGDRREAEGAKRTSTSLSLRHAPRRVHGSPELNVVQGASVKCSNSILLIVGSCATKDYKPRQVRKEAAVVIPFVCRRGAWLSTSYL